MRRRPIQILTLAAATVAAVGGALPRAAHTVI